MKFGRKQLVLASLVLALGAAVYLNWQFAGIERLPVGVNADKSSSQLGAAQLVNNSYVETVTDDLQQRIPVSSITGDSLSSARLNRQTARDEALELLADVLDSVNADSEAKKEAVDQASLIAQNILQETNAESLLHAKGYEDSVVFISNGECSVVVSGELKDADTLIIQEIVLEQTGLGADKIKIIGTK